MVRIYVTQEGNSNLDCVPRTAKVPMTEGFFLAGGWLEYIIQPHAWWRKEVGQRQK